MKSVTLYTKPDCSLCATVEETIAQVARRRRFRFKRRNILDDPIDHENYHEAIPVVVVDGTEIARYRLTAFQLEAALDAP
jgi:glutaredoxin